MNMDFPLKNIARNWAKLQLECMDVYVKSMGVTNKKYVSKVVIQINKSLVTLYTLLNNHNNTNTNRLISLLSNLKKY